MKSVSTKILNSVVSGFNVISAFREQHFNFEIKVSYAPAEIYDNSKRMSVWRLVKSFWHLVMIALDSSNSCIHCEWPSNRISQELNVCVCLIHTLHQTI